MSETSGAGPPGSGPPGPGTRTIEAPERPQYQPPAIAWEEPLEAMAAQSCAFNPDECFSQPYE